MNICEALAGGGDTMSDLFEQLAPGLAVVDAWPSPKPREDYIIELTDEEYMLVWSFMWRNMRSLPELVEVTAGREK